MFRTSLDQSSLDHKEAVRLARMCRHVPVWAIVIGGFALLNLAAAVASILAVSPVNGLEERSPGLRRPKRRWPLTVADET